MALWIWRRLALLWGWVLVMGARKNVNSGLVGALGINGAMGAPLKVVGKWGFFSIIWLKV